MASGIENATGQQAASFYTTGLTGNPAFDFFIENVMLPGIIDARNQEVPLMGMLYARTTPMGGKFATKKVKDGRNWAGISSIADEGNMPDPGRQNAYLYTIPSRNIYARLKISGKMLRLAKNGGSDIDPLGNEWDGVHEDLAIKQEFMMHNDGSGRRAEVVSVIAASITVRLNQDHEGIANVTTAPTLYLAPGMRVSFVTAGGTIRQIGGANVGLYVRRILTTTTIELSATLGGAAIDHTTITGLTAGDWIVDASRETPTSTDTAWKGEPMGLLGVMRDVGVLDGNAISTAGQQTGAQDFTLTAVTAAGAGFQGLPVNAAFSTYTPPAWNKAIIADGGGAVRPISDSLIQRALSDSRRINNAKVKLLISGWALYDAYIDTLIGDKRFNSNHIEGGHSGDGQIGGAGFNGLPWHKSRYYLDNMLTGLDPEMFGILENEPLTVAAPPGSPKFERLNDKDAFWCALVTEYNLWLDGTRDRAGFHLVDVA